MKTLSDYPGLLGRLVEAHEQRQRVRALPRLKRAVWCLQVFVDGLVRWVFMPLLKFIVVPALVGIAMAATLFRLFAQ